MAIEFAGSFRPWGYAASIGIPEALQKSGHIAFRAVIEVFEGTVGVGVTNAEDTDFLAQKLVGPGCHFIEIEVVSPQPVGPIVLRHASGEAGSSAFVLHLLQFPLGAGELGSGISELATLSRANSLSHPVFTKLPAGPGASGRE